MLAMLQQKVYNALCGWWICHCGFSVVNNIAYRERYVNEIHITISDSGLKSFLQKRFPIVEVPLESFQEADFFIKMWIQPNLVGIIYFKYSSPVP